VSGKVRGIERSCDLAGPSKFAWCFGLDVSARQSAKSPQEVQKRPEQTTNDRHDGIRIYAGQTVFLRYCQHQPATANGPCRLPLVLL